MTQFQKGHPDLVPPESRRRQALKMMGDKHFRWKGNKADVRSIHGWVKRIMGKPNYCARCGLTGALKVGRYEWANKSGRYFRKASDWIRMCSKCHRRMDQQRRKNRNGPLKKYEHLKRIYGKV